MVGKCDDGEKDGAVGIPTISKEGGRRSEVYRDWSLTEV